MYDGTPCLVTPGPVDRLGYRTCGTYRFGVKIFKRHRLAWIDHHGMLPPDDRPHVLHHCDNPPCENPLHLYAGTPAENLRDALERDRFRRPWSVAPHLTWDAVRALRAERAAGATLRVLAARYGVSETSVSRIALNRRWQDPSA